MDHITQRLIDCLSLPEEALAIVELSDEENAELLAFGLAPAGFLSFLPLIVKLLRFASDNGAVVSILAPKVMALVKMLSDGAMAKEVFGAIVDILNTLRPAQ